MMSNLSRLLFLLCTVSLALSSPTGLVGFKGASLHVKTHPLAIRDDDAYPWIALGAPSLLGLAPVLHTTTKIQMKLATGTKAPTLLNLPTTSPLTETDCSFCLAPALL
jgi:hypothetical protein